MAKIKQQGNKWIVESDEGGKKEEFSDKKSALRRLKQWEGHKAHSKGGKKDKKYHHKSSE